MRQVPIRSSVRDVFNGPTPYLDRASGFQNFKLPVREKLHRFKVVRVVRNVTRISRQAPRVFKLWVEGDAVLLPWPGAVYEKGRLRYA